jgi:hypothetical protein
MEIVLEKEKKKWRYRLLTGFWEKEEEDVETVFWYYRLIDGVNRV